MNTLVIHPKDESTDFLSEIYRDKAWKSLTDTNDKGWTIITTDVSKSFLKSAIKAHDRIIMLGHGTENGMYGFGRFIINSELVYLLREKYCVCIWCNANFFFERYKLKGFYTGMIISEDMEACIYSVSCSLQHIEESNLLFAKAIRESIDVVNSSENAKAIYNIVGNPIIEFNRENIFLELK